VDSLAGIEILLSPESLLPTSYTQKLAVRIATAVITSDVAYFWKLMFVYYLANIYRLEHGKFPKFLKRPKL
jgi:hypothetical protein